MKRLLVFTLAVFTISAVFAYEPKVECAKVKRNRDIKYYEKTEPYNRYGHTEPDTDYVQWVIRKDYTVEQHVDYVFQLLERQRNYYYFETEKDWMSAADRSKNAAIASLPFITEENFLTITKEEMIEMHNDFLQSVLNK